MQDHKSDALAHSMIRVCGLSTGYGAKVLLEDISFEIPGRGVLGLMGPSGVGKTTLLRTIARRNEGAPLFWARGEVYLDGCELLQSMSAEAVHCWLKLLPQKARLYTGSVLDNVVDGLDPERQTGTAKKVRWAEQILQPMGLWDEFKERLQEPVLSLSVGRHKMLCLAQLLATKPRCLFIDEPLQEVAVVEESELAELIRRIARKVPVVLITHNKTIASNLCDTVCFITGGRLLEVTPCDEFFSRPKTALGREFLRSGSAWPSPEAPLPPKRRKGVSRIPTRVRSLAPPRGFHWVLPKLMAGMAYPGLLQDEEKDLRALRHYGIRHVVNLTEKPYPGERLAEFDLIGEFFPIDDMGVPELEPTMRLCQRVSAWIDAGLPVVFHCKAGLGRTGALLAAMLVFRGASSVNSIARVRMVNSSFIQSDAQFAFIGQFADYSNPGSFDR